MPEYVEAFKKAFPNEPKPVTYDNIGKAIGAFERKLMTPSRWDEFLKGDQNGADARREGGLQDVHRRRVPGVPRGRARRRRRRSRSLGAAKPYPRAEDPGRFKVTKVEADRAVFKVPSLRNIEKTGPYFHDGKTATLEPAVRDMGEYQLGRTLSDKEVGQIVVFLRTLTGKLPTDYIKEPALPPSTRCDAEAGPAIGARMSRRVRIVLLLVVVALVVPAGAPAEADQSVREARGVVREAAAPPPDVARVVQRGCADCHSNRTRWPWYSRVSPASWLVVGDVNEARDALNLSEWTSLSAEKARVRLSDMCKQVRKGDMPPWQYLLIHRDARLSEADVAALCGFAVSRGAHLNHSLSPHGLVVVRNDKGRRTKSCGPWFRPPRRGGDAATVRNGQSATKWIPTGRAADGPSRGTR